jgi:hypothetical protein
MLSAAVDAYLTSRRAAGFQLHDHEGILRDFARFASAAGDAVVRTRTVLDWVRARDGSPKGDPSGSARSCTSLGTSRRRTPVMRCLPRTCLADTLRAEDRPFCWCRTR